MFRLPDKHQVFTRSWLWSVSLVSVAVFVPIVLARALPSRSPLTVSSSSEPSPQASPPPPQEDEDFLAEQQWRQQIMSKSLLLQPPTATNAKSTTVANKAPDAKADPPKPQSPTAKASTPQQKQSTPKTPASKPAQSKQQQTPKAATLGKTTPIPAQRQATQSLEMRVAIADGASSLVVASSTAAELQTANGKSIGKLPASQGKHVLPEGQTIRLGDVQAPQAIWVKPASGGLVLVNDRWYRGDMLLISLGDTLLAVNYVELESYLASVVGSEMPSSWPLAALKAQAIAARSYAIVHSLRPASRMYDLGSTQRWQVYKGVNSEWNTTTQAVMETAGVFLSYKGGIVESMYAASDDIVVNVFGGIGMSQNGARDLAVQGYDYQQILGTYYPGAGLSWIE
jgi:peptidoglycan hydrolase-like amidase